MNHESRPDLVMYGNGAPVVLLNDGHGNFSVMTAPLPSGYVSASALVLADFNGDGWPDAGACVINTSGSAPIYEVAVYLNAHSGALTLSTTLPAPHGCLGISAGDANRDGKEDIAFTFQTAYPPSQPGNTNGLTTFFGDGTGKFPQSVTQSNVALTATQNPDYNPCLVSSLAGSDFDGDGVLDLVLFANCQPSAINTGDMYFAKGDGTGHYLLTQINESTSLQGNPVVKDVDGDGKLDIVFGTDVEGPHASSSSALEFAINNGAGQFNIVTPASENSYAGDGCCGPFTYGAKLYTGKADGKFALSQTFTYGQSSDSIAGMVGGAASADFNGNGAPDFAVAAADANSKATLHVYLQ